MESITENKLFLFLLSSLTITIFISIFEIIPDMNETLELVELPYEVLSMN